MWLTSLREHRALVLAITAVCILVLVGVVVWWVNASGYESTDDAFIDARTVTISSQLSAQVVDVPVTDNQLVDAGTVLVRLDNSDYQAQVDQAKAQVDQAQANIANIDAQIAAQQARIDQANKQVVQAQAALTFAQQQNERYGGLVKSGSVTVEQAQQYSSNFLQAQASFAAAQANAVATEKQLPVLQSQRLQARGAVGTDAGHAGAGADQSVAHRRHRAGRRALDQPHRREGYVRRGRAGAHEFRAARRVGHGKFQGDAA